MRSAALIFVAFLWPATAAGAQPLTSTPAADARFHIRADQPRVQVGKSSFALPVVDYRAPDGTRKRDQGIIFGREIAPNATVGVGFFKSKPKYEDETRAPAAVKSRKVALGLSLKF